jgi:dipeptidyl aminopeptidase/acylaminoacyl peptidase
VSTGRPSAARSRVAAAVTFISAAFVLAPFACPARAQQATAAPARLVHRYLEVRISPDATRVAAVEGDSPPGGYSPLVRDLVIHSLNRAADVRIALPCGRTPECWPGAPAWAPDGRLAFTLRTPGSHRYSLYTVAADGSGLRKRLDFDGTLDELKYAADGTLAMLAVAGAQKEVGATEAGVEIAGDLDAPAAEQRIGVLVGDQLQWASPADLFVYEYEWRPGAGGFVGTAAPGNGDNNWWTAKLYAFERSDGTARVLYTPESIRQQLAQPRVSPDGKSVAFIAGLMSDFGSTGGDVYSVDLETGSALDLTPGIKASAAALGWSCRGELRVLLRAGSQVQLALLGRGRTATPPHILWSGAESLSGGHTAGPAACPSEEMAVAHESYTSAPEIEAGANGRWRDITHANAGLSLAAHVQSISWTNDGFEEQGWLLTPPGAAGRMPMVTTIHGGPAAEAGPSFAGPGLQWHLLERGWAVFYPNPRGSFGQGERFASANVRDFGHGDLRDVLAGIDAAERAAPIDDARLGLTGGSYGGFMTMWAVTQTSRFKAAVAAAGISDWQSYYGENGIDEWMLPYFGASVYQDPAVYARASAIDYIRNVHTPTFAYVGERDIECPAPQTQEFWHALKSLGVPTAIMIYPGEGHGLRDPAHAEDAMQRTLAWFDRYLR